VCSADDLGKLCIVSQDDTNGDIEDLILTSSDGLNWEKSESIPQYISLRNVVRSPELGLFVAVGTNGSLYSSDGKNWQLGDISSNEWRDIAWSSKLGLFCAVASGGTNNRIAISNNGINWSLVNDNLATRGRRAVVWSPELELFVLVSRST
jgi:photosystem II stability/assembly factor-like uncharacterized protein